MQARYHQIATTPLRKKQVVPSVPTTPASDRPIDRLLYRLSRSYEDFSDNKGLAAVRLKLGLNYCISNTTPTLKNIPLDKHKRSVYKIWVEDSVCSGPIGSELVVKLNPRKGDTWTNVKQEAEIMRIAKRDAVPKYPLPVPEVLYESNDADVRAVGTEFIIREYVDGMTFSCAGELPTDGRRTQILVSAVLTLANIHSYYWVWLYGNGRMEKIDYINKKDFWTNEVCKWSRNYGQAQSTNNPSDPSAVTTNKLFEDMKKAKKPDCGLTTLVHGDFDLSNLVFDKQTFEVKAILDWKSMQNGSPLSDFGYFMMIFLQPEQFGLGHRSKQLEQSKLLLGKPGTNGTPQKEALILVYKAVFMKVHLQTDFDKEYKYSKALACARFLSVVQAAAKDDFQGHESGDYRSVTSNPKAVIQVLTTAGRTFLDEWDEGTPKKNPKTLQTG